jgi:allantoin racemase
VTRRKRRIRVVVPVVTQELANAEEMARAAGPDTDLSVVLIESGPASIETFFDEAIAAPDTIRRIVEAEHDGVDAVVIDCMGDPGMEGAREMVQIPVVGPGQASMNLAAMLGHRFSVVSILDQRVVAQFERQARVYGVWEKLASVRWVEVAVLDLGVDRADLTKRLVAESTAAIERDGAHVIVFGCTGMYGYADAVRAGLHAIGHGDVPVIDPFPAAVRLAETLVDLRLSPSKRSYPLPPVKEIRGFPLYPTRTSVG